MYEFYYINKHQQYDDLFIVSDIDKSILNNYAKDGIMFALKDKASVPHILKCIESYKPKNIFIDESLTKYFKGKIHLFYEIPNTSHAARNRNIIYHRQLKEIIYLVNKVIKPVFNIKCISSSSGENYNLKRLLNFPMLAVDIETTGFNILNDKIISISFAISEYNSIALEYSLVKNQLKEFFQNYQGKLIFHNGLFDIPFIVYKVFMENDYYNHKGRLEGFNAFEGKIEDTMIMAYLNNNSVYKTSYSLKKLSYEFIGEYSFDFKLYPIKTFKSNTIMDNLLHYNAKDTLATFYVYYKYNNGDYSQKLYRKLYLPLVIALGDTSITGIEINRKYFLDLEVDIVEKNNTLTKELQSLKPVVLTKMLKSFKTTFNKNKVMKTKVNDPIMEDFNPGSSQDLRILIYDVLGLTVYHKTKKGLPGTDKNALKYALKELKNKNPDNTQGIKALSNIIEIARTANIVSNTLKNLNNNNIAVGDTHLFFSSFNIIGTKTGRVSSPFLMTLPSKRSAYAKPLKKGLLVPEGYTMISCDYDGLEDVVLTIKTKDPNREKIYTEGYDGHSFRAYYYFKDKINIPDESVDSINSIQVNYSKLREDSKVITFAMSYFGTPYTLEKNSGLPTDIAQSVYDNYHNLYAVTSAWYEKEFDFCREHGYVRLAFGHKLRSKLFKHSIKGVSYNYLEKERRTLGNALIQSYGLLTLYALVRFRRWVINNGYYDKIRIITVIHDDIKILVDNNNPEFVTYIGNKLKAFMEDITLPELQHPSIKITASPSISLNNWSEEQNLN